MARKTSMFCVFLYGTVAGMFALFLYGAYAE